VSRLRAQPSLHWLLAALILVVLVGKPLGDLGLVPQHHGMLGALILVFVAGIAGVAPAAGRLRWVIVAIGLLAIAVHFHAFTLPPEDDRIVATASSMLCLVIIGVAALRQALGPGRVTLRRVEGAIIVYLLIGFIFAGAYDLIEAAFPDSFALLADRVSQYTPRGDVLFFSFVTLTSTGYGDQVPVHPVARAVAILEALTGQLYLAIVLARLVSLEIAGRDRE
jgi:hypothetical protein